MFTCNAPVVSSEWVGGEVVWPENGRAARTVPGSAGRRFDSGRSCEVSRTPRSRKRREVAQ